MIERIIAYLAPPVIVFALLWWIVSEYAKGWDKVVVP